MLVAAIDQGTTSSRCILFGEAGAIVALARKEHRQIHPRPGWVEHDASEIWRNVEQIAAEALAQASVGADAIAALGIANQRETSLLWRRDTGEPIHNAIVWQDTRTDEAVRVLAGEEGPDRFRGVCGLPLATYFSAPKIAWLLDHVEGARTGAERGDILFGTMDSWLIWKLTGRHVTDVTNASRTMLMNLATLDWDEGLLDAFGVPRAMLPEIRSSSEIYGTARGALAGVPVAGALGDQQAALFGQTCFAPGEAKATYGTGTFLLLNTGAAPVPSAKGLLTTVAYRIGEAPAAFALEGSVAVSGALVQWLRDNLGLIASADEIEALAASVPDNGGCTIVPAFSGLFAPWWRSDARGVIAGLTAFVGKGHVARAALEAAAWQTHDLVEAMNAESAAPLAALRVDGGMTVNALLMQFQADVLGVPVVRPKVTETTCLGAGFAAGLAAGVWNDTDELRALWRHDAEWRPAMDAGAVAAGRRQWRKAIERSLGWIDGQGGNTT